MCMTYEELINLGRRHYPYDENNTHHRTNIVNFHNRVFQSLSEEQRLLYTCLNITETEMYSYLMLIGFASDQIQAPLRNQQLPDPFINQIISELDRFLLKCHKNTSRVLYRQDNYSDISRHSPNDIITHQCFYNTSIDNWNNSYNATWIITPKSPRTTNAYKTYEVYNHGDENQVTFRRGSSFQIDCIENHEQENEANFYIYCHEI